VITFFMVAAVLALAGGRPGTAWLLWGIGFVVKPQPIVIVPALAAFTFWRFGPSGLLRGALGASAGVFAMLAYFLVTGNGPYLWDVYRELFQTYDTQISVNAWNLWWVGQQEAGLRASDALISLGPLKLTVEGCSFLLLVGSTLAILAFLRRRPDLAGLLVACALLEFAFYLLPISTHERYLYPFFAFLAPIVVLQAGWFALYAPLAAIFFLNIFFASPTDPDMSKAALNSRFGYAMSSLNVVLYTTALVAIIGRALRERRWPFVRPAARPAEV
jgi:hypothetical protein